MSIRRASDRFSRKSPSKSAFRTRIHHGRPQSPSVFHSHFRSATRALLPTPSIFLLFIYFSDGNDGVTAGVRVFPVISASPSQIQNGGDRFLDSKVSRLPTSKIRCFVTGFSFFYRLSAVPDRLAVVRRASVQPFVRFAPTEGHSPAGSSTSDALGNARVS